MPPSLLKKIDLFAPIFNKVEGTAVAKVVPNASKVPNRRRLSDYCDECNSKNEFFNFDHSKWDAVLKRHVTTGATIGSVTGVNVVDYAGVAADPDFAAYLRQLEDADPSTAVTPGADELAFWMNAYNALCISLIVQHERASPSSSQPLTSINQLSEKDHPVWDKIAGKVGGMEISLNTIEHERLRKAWDEPSLHSCIVCASASCPNLRPEAFVVERLEEQMMDQMRQWLKNETFGLKYTPSKNRLELSRIFLWFASDFGGWKGLQKWLPRYIEDEITRKAVAHGNLAVRYFTYSWVLNRAPSSGTATTSSLVQVEQASPKSLPPMQSTDPEKDDGDDYEQGEVVMTA